WWRHLFWMCVNTVVAPFTVVLAILPGPNVIGFWFLYRAIVHALIVLGIRRARRGRIPLELRPATSLDRPIERDQGGKAAQDASDGGAGYRDEQVAWSQSESSGVVQAGDPPAAATTSQPADAGSEEPRDG